MKIIGLILLPFFLLACSSNDSGPGNQSPTVTARSLPDQISEKPLISKPELTPNQKEFIKLAMRKAALMPPSDLLLPPPNESQQAKAERLEKIAKLPADSKKIYDLIVANCILNSGESVQTGNPQGPPGSAFSETVNSSIDGANCVVQTARNSKSAGVVVENNVEQVMEEYKQTGDTKVLDKLRHSFESKTVVTESQQIKSDQISLVTGIENVQLNGTVDSFFQIKYFQGSLMMNVYLKLDGEAIGQTTSNQNFKVQFRGEMLAKDQISQSYQEDNFFFPEFDFTVQKYQKNGEHRYFLNGKEVSKADLKDLLGTTQNRLPSLGMKSLTNIRF